MKEKQNEKRTEKKSERECAREKGEREIERDRERAKKESIMELKWSKQILSLKKESWKKKDRKINWKKGGGGGKLKIKLKKSF